MTTSVLPPRTVAVPALLLLEPEGVPTAPIPASAPERTTEAEAVPGTGALPERFKP
ncbi:hypothetical protein [Arthrobacter sp. AFG7.2]|uniref:hypothetical protein n=1 Tax=Arthrobacter sp. AFG7.2 TaxID=1688693 RepID=UPI001CB94EBF|nr:hypothetical protein [Arthrobacter sp. AFG7.2]